MVSVSCRSPPSRPNFFRLSHTERAHALSPNEQVTLSLLSSTHHHHPLPPDSPEAHQEGRSTTAHLQSLPSCSRCPPSAAPKTLSATASRSAPRTSKEAQIRHRPRPPPARSLLCRRTDSSNALRDKGRVATGVASRGATAGAATVVMRWRNRGRPLLLWRRRHGDSGYGVCGRAWRGSRWWLWWLSAVAAQAIQGWILLKPDSFKKLEKVLWSFQLCHSFRLIQFNSR
jgi:hypothetical protein